MNYDAAADAVERARRALFEGAPVEAVNEEGLIEALDTIATAKWADRRRSNADAIRTMARRELGRSIARRWFGA